MEPDKFVIDSSVFVAFYYEHDKNHSDALKIMSDTDNKTLIIHPYVIAETSTVLTYKLGNYVASGFLSDIANAHNVTIPQINIKDDIDYFKNLNKKISFIDASLINLAKQTASHLVTFDRQMLALFKK